MKFQNNIVSIPVKADSTLEDLLISFHLSRKQRYLLCAERKIRVNSHTITQSVSLKQGDMVSIQLEPSKDTISSWNHPIQILYEDDVILVVNKPSGMLVHSDGSNTDHTLCNAVKAYYDQSSQDVLVRPIHRLDVETSGAILFSKQPFFQSWLDDCLANKQIHREYYALCEGILEKDFWDIQKGMARDRHNAKKMRIDDKGKNARTQIRVIQRYHDHTLVSCQLFTGRTHQIRVHLASIHHPILSDSLYGRKDPRITRCALHAYQLTFVHPVTKQSIVCTCDMPKDMKNLLR